MVHIFTALYCEAHIFIRRFQLAKNQENHWFQEFFNEAAGVRLTVTGVGGIAAAAAVGSACSSYRPDDLLLNVGTCAHTAGQDGIFLCNKITEEATGRTFYPDMLCRHNFREGAIVTGMLPWDGEHDGTAISTESPAGCLYDMEAAAVYQAGSYFFGPHQMVFMKIVSDRDAAKEVSRERVVQLMENYQDLIFDYISSLSSTLSQNSSYSLCQEEEIVRTFCADLHCSKAMGDSMRQYIHYLTLAKIDYISIIQNMYERGLLPCRDKREGKQRFEEFKRSLF